jgi:hypothetical protein
MLRRILLASVLGIGGTTGLTATADAHPPMHRWHEHRFEVFYREGHCGWQCYGTFRERCDADRAAEHLRCQGFRVDIRPC